MQADLLEIAGLKAGSSNVSIPAWQGDQIRGLINDLYDKRYPPLPENLGDPSLAEYLPGMPDSQKNSPTGAGSEKLPESGGKNVRCICLNSGMIPDMIQCQIEGCGIWQHLGCVGKPKGSHFACEACRFYLADPFLRVVEDLLPLGKLKEMPGMPPIRDMRGNIHYRISLEQSFYLSPQIFQSCQGKSATRRVTISCLNLGDEIYTRMHWPKNVSVRVNNLNVKPYMRGPSTELGINQRDSPVDVTRLVVHGHNSIRIAAVDNGAWVVRISISEKETKETVKSMMKSPEALEEGKKRMQRQLAGDTENALGLERMTFTLKDPLTCTRIEHAARFEDASGPQAFELDSYLSMAELNRKWQDPTTLKNSTILKLRSDVYTGRILEFLKSIPSITRIEVNAEGNWRPEGYEKEWFDVCKDLSSENIESLKAFANSELDESQNNDGTEEYDGRAAIDSKTEVVEAMSALITLRKDPPRVVQNSGGQKRRPEVEVIDLLSSDEE